MTESQAIMMGKPGRRSVEQASAMIKKLYYVERELMRTLGGYHVNVSDWELKKALPRHIWEDSLRADALRTRVLEMRYPRKDVDGEHDPRLTRILSCLIRCRDDAELVIGVYYVAKQALVSAYEAYLKEADPLDDAPTLAFMRGYPSAIRRQIDEIGKVYHQLPEVSYSGYRDPRWYDALHAYLTNIGGWFAVNDGDAAWPEELASRGEYAPPLTPRRDPRFTPAVYHLPEGVPVHKFIDRQVWSGINHVNEMWAAETPNLIMWKWNDMPWDFYLDCARWAYDETRHCMMGEERLKAWGFETGVDYPIVADHYISVADKGELALLAMMHIAELHGPPAKSQMKKDFEAVGDTASSQDFDYDWADESIHLSYGHKWVLHRLNGDMEAMEDLKDELMERWKEWIVQKYEEWDYEPFATRIRHKIAEVERKFGAGSTA